MRESTIREIIGDLETSCISLDIASNLILTIKENGEDKKLLIYLAPKEARKIVKDIQEELHRRRIKTPKPRRYKVRK